MSPSSSPHFLPSSFEPLQPQILAGTGSAGTAAWLPPANKFVTVFESLDTLHYHLEVDMGQPAQPLRIILDTGSSDLVLLSSLSSRFFVILSFFVRLILFVWFVLLQMVFNRSFCQTAPSSRHNFAVAPCYNPYVSRTSSVGLFSARSPLLLLVLLFSCFDTASTAVTRFGLVIDGETVFENSLRMFSFPSLLFSYFCSFFLSSLSHSAFYRDTFSFPTSDVGTLARGSLSSTPAFLLSTRIDFSGGSAPLHSFRDSDGSATFGSSISFHLLILHCFCPSSPV
jgi:hypothetical protein